MISGYPRLSAAQDALDAGRLQEAAQLALVHIREHPGEPRGLALLGRVAMRMGAFGQAEQFFRQALSREPNDSRLLQDLILCLQQQERPLDTLEMLEKMEASLPDDPQVSLSISLILDKLGRSEEAGRRLEAITEKHPANINAWLAYASTTPLVPIAGPSKSTSSEAMRGGAWPASAGSFSPTTILRP